MNQPNTPSKSNPNQGLVMALLLVCIVQAVGIFVFYKQNQQIIAQQKLMTENFQVALFLESSRYWSAKTDQLDEHTQISQLAYAKMMDVMQKNYDYFSQQIKEPNSSSDE